LAAIARVLTLINTAPKTISSMSIGPLNEELTPKVFQALQLAYPGEKSKFTDDGLGLVIELSTERSPQPEIDRIGLIIQSVV
jgi:hypothetical protein